MQRKRYTVGLCLIILSVFLSFYACNKKDFWHTKDSEKKSAQEKIDLPAARAWFENKHKRSINALVLLSTDKWGGSTASLDPYPLTPGSFAGAPPDWNDKRLNKNGSVNIALSNGILPGTSIVYFRDLIIGKGRDGKYKEVIEHVEYDAAYLQRQLALRGRLPHLRAYVDAKTFTGKIAYYSLQNRFVKGVIMKNGIVEKVVYPVGVRGFKAKVLSSVGGSPRKPRTYASFGGEDPGVVDDPDLPDITLPPGGSPGFPDPFPDPSFPDDPLPEGHFLDEYWVTYPGGNYGPPPPPPSDDPCEKAKGKVQKVTDLSKTKHYEDAREAIKQKMLGDGTKIQEHATFLKGNGTISSVKTGEETSVNIAIPADAVANFHNHPNNVPPAAGDVYGLIESNRKYPTYDTRYVLLPNGNTYALVVTDPAAAKEFFKKYPPSKVSGAAPNFSGETNISYQDCFSERTMEKISMEDATFIAMTYVLDTYNSGIAILKLEKNGNFVKQSVNATLNSVGDNVYSISTCP